jgi:ribose transport system permease protein
VLNLGANYQYLVQGTVIIAAAAVYTVAGQRRRAATTAPEAPPGPAQPGGEIPAAEAADEPVS